MVYDSSLVTASCYPDVVVLNDLQLLDVGWGRNYELEQGYGGNDKPDKGYVGQDQGFLLLTPVGPCERFSDFSALTCF